MKQIKSFITDSSNYDSDVNECLKNIIKNGGSQTQVNNNILDYNVNIGHQGVAKIFVTIEYIVKPI